MSCKFSGFCGLLLIFFGFFSVPIAEKSGIIDQSAIIFYSFRIISCYFGTFHNDSQCGGYYFVCQWNDSGFFFNKIRIVFNNGRLWSNFWEFEKKPQTRQKKFKFFKGAIYLLYFRELSLKLFFWVFKKSLRWEKISQVFRGL